MDRLSNTFTKKERLTGQKLIANLFENGETSLVYPLKVIYLETEFSDKYQAKAAFSISKKNFRKAVDRNLLKRRMREAYRLNKANFYANLKNKNLAVMFIYVAKDILPYSSIEKSLKTILNKLA
ncbi:MAG: ribonuclease P protein component [Mariniphaga sp.]|nr:ribonuclease P protein component [Mariniphaga sp.]